jgi:DNA invertase Pin-like site-specific DNA recombinase
MYRGDHDLESECGCDHQELCQVCPGDVAHREDAQRQQRNAGRRLTDDECGEKAYRQGSRKEGASGGPAVLSCPADRVNAEHEASRGQARARPVGATAQPAPVVGIQELDRKQAGHNADRRIDEKDPVPADSLRQDTAEHEADRRARGADEAERADRFRPLARFGEQGHDHAQADRRHHGTADPLGKPCGDQHRGTGSKAAQQRRGRKDRQPGAEHSLAAAEIAETAGEQQQAAEGDQVSVHDPAQAGLDRDQTGLDSQEREAVRWAEQEGHEVVAVVADFKSGKSHLWDRPNLRPWVLDAEKLGQYDAVVALKVDRLTRADDAGVDAMKAWAREHCKSLLISSASARFPSEGTDGIIWDTMIRVAHAEWLATQERYLRMQRTLREKGSAVGRAPWGFEIAKVDDRKLFVPTDLGRKYIPAIFERVIAGESLRSIAQWLDSEGVPTIRGGRWNQGWIANRLIKNRLYMGDRVNGGNIEVEPLVPATLWQQAQAALESRARPGRDTTVHDKALLRPVCGRCFGVTRPGCPDGVSPMYKITGATQKQETRKPYYRCFGSGPQRKGCGFMIPVELLDRDVIFRLSRDTAPHVEREFVAGDDRADQIEALKLKLDSAKTRAESNALWDEIERLEAEPAMSAHWREHKTNLTRGRYFRSLDDAGQREYLAQWRPVVSRDEDGEIVIAMDAFQFDRSTNAGLVALDRELSDLLERADSRQPDPACS